jgi:hypothetical protein
VAEAGGSPDITQRIDRLQRRRLILLSISAVSLLTWISVSLWSSVLPGGQRTGDLVCMIAFLIWIGALAGMLTGRAGPMRDQVIRAVLNDELTMAHRRTALMCGYWLTLAGLAVVYVWSHFSCVDARDVVPVLLGAAVAVPTLCFVFLERRSERDG